MNKAQTESSHRSFDYRRSHLDPDKGLGYDRRYRDLPWRRYLWSREQAVLRRIVADHLDDRPIRYLDFACGTGRIMQFLQPQVASCSGIDLSDTMLQLCRDKLPDAEIIAADLTERDVLAARQFDLITAFRFFTNAQPELRRQALAILARHLADDGVLVINNHRNASSLLLRTSRILNKDLHCMSEQEVGELTIEAGLSIIDAFPIGLWPGHDSVPMILPSWLHRLMDQSANRFGLGRSLCQDILYVCRKARISPRFDSVDSSAPSNRLCEMTL